jgi:sulfide:quinone oxidoreductase
MAHSLHAENKCCGKQREASMARMLIAGGGFGGLVTAEKLAAELGSTHEITLVSPSRTFTFYPALVQLAFGECEREEMQFDMFSRLKDLGVHFIEGEMTGLVRDRKAIEISGKDVRGEISYDYAVFALGRRLATEKVPGFFSHAHHLLSLDSAQKFGDAVRDFTKGDIVLGACPGGRLPIPLCEAAFHLSKRFEREIEAGDVRLKLLFPESVDDAFGGAQVHKRLEEAFVEHKINVIYNVPIVKVTEDDVFSSEGHKIHHDLLMLIPPFKGNPIMSGLGFTDPDDFVMVDGSMRIYHRENAYAVGDNVAFSGPKLAHMAVRQAQVAAANIASEIRGEQPKEVYYHEIAAIVDGGGADSIYIHFGIWDEELYRLKKGRFWGFAKQAHDAFWQAQHS